jgi:hypothetical protein
VVFGGIGDKMEEKIFLGGTCNNSTWRDKLIPILQAEYFNPVVKDWTPECQEEEYKQKEEICRIHFYCITKEMTGVFSIAEVVDSVNNEEKLTYLQVMPDGFDDKQLKSLRAVVDLVRKRGGIAYMDNDITRGARLLNYAHASQYSV